MVEIQESSHSQDGNTRGFPNRPEVNPSLLSEFVAFRSVLVFCLFQRSGKDVLCFEDGLNFHGVR